MRKHQYRIIKKTKLEKFWTSPSIKFYIQRKETFLGMSWWSYGEKSNGIGWYEKISFNTLKEAKQFIEGLEREEINKSEVVLNINN